MIRDLIDGSEDLGEVWGHGVRSTRIDVVISEQSLRRALLARRAFRLARKGLQLRNVTTKAVVQFPNVVRRC